MAEVYDDLQSLSDSLKPEIDRFNQQIIAGEMSKIQSQASKLLNTVNQLWRGYENSYQPSVYIRTGATKAGFSLSEPRIVEKNGETAIEVDLILDDGNMWHDSLWGGRSGHSFMLISEGWDAPALRAYRGGMDTYRLTTFNGVGIIDTLITSFNTSDLEFKFYYEGQEYGGSRDKFSRSFTR